MLVSGSSCARARFLFRPRGFFFHLPAEGSFLAHSGLEPSSSRLPPDNNRAQAGSFIPPAKVKNPGLSGVLFPPAQGFFSARVAWFPPGWCFFSICLRRARFPPSPGSNPCRVAQGMFFSSEGFVFRVKCSFLIRCWTNRFHVARCQYSSVTRFGGFFSTRGCFLFHPFLAGKGFAPAPPRARVCQLHCVDMRQTGKNKTARWNRSYRI